MPTATIDGNFVFWGLLICGFLLTLLIGGALAILWSRSSAAADQAREAAQTAAPIAATLERIEGQMRQFEAHRQQAMGGLETQLSSLSKDTIALGQALRGTNSRGRWGELTLRRVAELAGMVPHCDFYEQQSAGAQAGARTRSRPDMIVRLPGDRQLPVDAKAPLAGYLEAEAAKDPAARTQALDRHMQQLWRHVAELAGREYWSQFTAAPEMVVLFLPGEHFLAAALERRPELLEAALEKKVLIATPVTLISVLKGVAHGWRQQKLAENAEELRRIAGEFHERVRVFGGLYADAGRHLARAVAAYNKSAGSWDTRLAPSLRRMQELGAAGHTEAPAPPHIETVPREPQQLDLTGELVEGTSVQGRAQRSGPRIVSN